LDDGGPELMPKGRGRGVLGVLSLVFWTAVAGIGCGPGTPRFSHTFESPSALAGEFLRLLAARDAAGLAALPLSAQEFRREVFPQMPAAGKIPADFVWSDLDQKSRQELGRVLARHGGRQYRLVRVAFEGGATAYRTFVVHRKPRLLLEDVATGARTEMGLFGSVLEQDKRFKLFSFVVNR
jgi:hypothetical protein